MDDDLKVISIAGRRTSTSNAQTVSREEDSLPALDYEKRLELDEKVRARLLVQIDRAFRQAKENGLLYTMRYLKAALIAAETEAGDNYFRNAADEECDRSG